MQGQKAKYITPFIILFALLILLGWELFYSNPNELPSALIGEDVPAFNLPNLYPSGPALTNNALSGRTVLLNVWATWCYACGIEHEMLMKIKNQYHVLIYSIDYKDNSQKSRAGTKGQPYALTGADIKGTLSILVYTAHLKLS